MSSPPFEAVLAYEMVRSDMESGIKACKPLINAGGQVATMAALLKHFLDPEFERSRLAALAAMAMSEVARRAVEDDIHMGVIT